jgi:orotate phosphoribosyltransferase
MDAVLKDLLSLMTPRQGHFRYESGHHGRIWLDLEPMHLRPPNAEPFARTLARKLAVHRPDSVCGPLVEGAFLARSVAYTIGVGFTWAEQEHSQGGGLYPVFYRIPRSLRRSVAGKRVAVVDDVINAGSAVRGTLADLVDAGAIPVVVGALLIRGPPAGQRQEEWGVPVESLASMPFEIWTPEVCPLCAEGMPLEDFSAG